MLVLELVIGCVGVDHNPLHTVTAELLLSLRYQEEHQINIMKILKLNVILYRQKRLDKLPWLTEPKVSKPQVDLKYVDRLVRSERKFNT